MSLIEKIDAEIKESEQYGCEAEYRAGLYKAKEIILSEQKEPCEFCEDGIYHDVLGSPCKYYYCPMCGRPLNQPYMDSKQN